MKKLFIIILLIIAVACNSFATNLRGYIQKCNAQHECSPSKFTYIQLYNWDGNKWVPGTDTYSGADGYYYFYDITPGTYNVCVNKTYWYQITIGKSVWQDVAVLTYNFS
jgi:hypothetical protein